jgi:signal transduction histidine kinase
VARAPVPVDVEAHNERLPAPVESAAYFVVSEALANVAKYAQATHASVTVERRNGELTSRSPTTASAARDLGAGRACAG